MSQTVQIRVPDNSTSVPLDYSDSNTTIQTLRIAVRKFVEDREWTKYHTARNLAESIAIEASELLELYQWGLNETTDDPARADKVEEELADVLIYCIGLANVMGIDLTTATLDKMRKNEKKYPADKYKGSYSKPVGG